MKSMKGLPMNRCKPVDAVKVLPVVRVHALRGTGTDTDIARIVTSYWSIKGELLAEVDPAPDRSEAINETLSLIAKTFVEFKGTNGTGGLYKAILARTNHAQEDTAVKANLIALQSVVRYKRRLPSLNAFRDAFQDALSRPKPKE
jgi:hypothetical protein